MKLFVPYVLGKPLDTIRARWHDDAGEALIVTGENAGSFEPFDTDNLATYLVMAEAEQAGVYVIAVPAGAASLPCVVYDLELGVVIAQGQVDAMAYADRLVDTSDPDQWELVYRARTSHTELLRHKLYDAAGNPLRSERTIVGGAESEPAESEE